ncbi:MAG: putative maltokinase [Deltaproteobacteria bacterium]|nr:putative maltokinase [Deltaproteobacteria bacterium]
MCIPTRRLQHLTLDRESLGSLLPELLPSFLPTQRWYGARSTPVRNASVIDVIPIPDADIEAADVLTKVLSIDGAEGVYQLVLGIADPRAIPERFVLAKLELPSRTACLYDVLGIPSDCERILRTLQRRSALAGSQARVRIDWTAALAEMAPPFRARPLDSEQSNSSIVFGERAILKVFRRVEPGTHPDVEVTRFLTAVGFADIPRYLGELSYASPDGSVSTLAGIQEYVANDGDGWADALRRIRAYLDDPTPGRLRADAAVARELGITTAQMHLALATPGADSAFAAEPITGVDLNRWRQGAIDALRRATPALGDAHLLDLIPAVESLLDALAAVPNPGRKQRLHGDFHLGQVLRAADRWVIFDFEGEPSRPIAERRGKHTPLRDVAGMLRSFDYAAFAVLFERAQPAEAAWHQLEPLALAWEEAARQAFLQGWTDTVRDTHAAPSDASSTSLLLDALELDKALYELGYELDHRPGWLPIPLHGMKRIISRRRV